MLAGVYTEQTLPHTGGLLANTHRPTRTDRRVHKSARFGQEKTKQTADTLTPRRRIHVHTTNLWKKKRLASDRSTDYPETDRQALNIKEIKRQDTIERAQPHIANKKHSLTTHRAQKKTRSNMISNEKTYLFLLAFMIFSSASLCKYCANFFFYSFFHSSFFLSFAECVFFFDSLHFFIRCYYCCSCISPYIGMYTCIHTVCVCDTGRIFSVCHYSIHIYIEMYIHIHIFLSICILSSFILSEERLMAFVVHCGEASCFANSIPTRPLFPSSRSNSSECISFHSIPFHLQCAIYTHRHTHRR